MFLSKCIYSVYPDPIYQNPKLDYIPYFKDMQRFSSAYLDESMLHEKSGYAFSQLIDHAINDNKNILSLLQQGNIGALINASYEYDSHYSHVGPYLAEKYSVSANLLDITEQSNLCLVSAFHILSAFFSQKKIKQGLIIGFEQRALPLRISANQPLPLLNGIGVIALSSTNSDQKADLKIMESDIISLKKIEEKITALKKNNIVYCYILTQYSDAVIPDFLFHLKTSVVAIASGILPLFIFFDQLLCDATSHEQNAVYVALIKDVKLKEWGMAVFQNGGAIIN